MTKIIKAMMEMGVKGILKTAGPEDIRFQAVFFVGPAGSGKSFIRTKRYMKYMNFRVIDPDEVKKAHPDYDPNEPAALHGHSKAVTNKQFEDIVTGRDGIGDAVIVDGTGNKPDNILKKMKLAKKNGYRIFVIYVYVPWQVSIFRNRNRSRFVPEDVVLQQTRNVAKSFTVLRGMANKSKVIPNFTNGQLAEAQADVDMYPPPQKSRPPRPGDANYGTHAFERQDTYGKAASVDESVAAGLLELAKALMADESEPKVAFTESDVENFVRDSLSGTHRKTNEKLMYRAIIKGLGGIGRSHFGEIWAELVDEGYLVPAGGSSYRWEM